MFRVTARRRAAAALSSIGHGPSSIPPEILFKYVRSKPAPTSSDTWQWSAVASPLIASNQQGIGIHQRFRNAEKKEDASDGSAAQSSNVVRLSTDIQKAPLENKLFGSASARIADATQDKMTGKKRDARGAVIEQRPAAVSQTTIAPAAIREDNEGLFVRLTCANAEENALVQRFNNALARASRALYNDAYRLELWDAYTRLKSEFPLSLWNFPRPAWTKLWKIQASLRPTDVQRVENLEIIASDIESHSSYGVWVEKEVVRLEKLFASGKEQEALAEWQSHCEGWSPFRRHLQAKGGKVSEKWKEWLELGVRLYALAGDTDAASALTQQILRRYRNCDPRFIFVQILAFNHWPDRMSHRRAWMLYLQLRRLPKFSLCLDDFQGLFHSFLIADEKRCALAILGDMKRLDIAQDELTPAVLDCVEALFKSCQTEAELEKYAISALAVVPPQLQSAAYYTSWLAQTCNVGSPKDMAKVIELMFERGTSPKASHFDGLLRSWLESEDIEANRQGEALAWNMIQRHDIDTDERLRKKLWRSRPRDTKTKKLLSTRDARMFTARPLPKATGNTFIRLARYYANTGHAENARHVVALLMSTDIKPSRSHFRAILAIHTKMKDFANAWQFFKKSLSDPALSYDLSTYSTLWQALIQQLHRQVFEPRRELRDQIGGLPPPRELFQHMQEFIHKHSPITTVDDSAAFKKYSIPKSIITKTEAMRLHQRVLRAFALSKDTFGALLAMRSLNSSLGITPNVETVITLVHHAAHEAMLAECKIQNRLQNVEEYMPMAMQVLASLYQFSDPDAPTEKAEAARELLSSEIRRKGVRLLGLLEGFLRRVCLGGMTRQQVVLGLTHAQAAMGLLERATPQIQPGSGATPMLA